MAIEVPVPQKTFGQNQMAVTAPQAADISGMAAIRHAMTSAVTKLFGAYVENERDQYAALMKEQEQVAKLNAAFELNTAKADAQVALAQTRDGIKDRIAKGELSWKDAIKTFEETVAPVYDGIYGKLSPQNKGEFYNWFRVEAQGPYTDLRGDQRAFLTADTRASFTKRFAGIVSTGSASTYDWSVQQLQQAKDEALAANAWNESEAEKMYVDALDKLNEKVVFETANSIYAAGGVDELTGEVYPEGLEGAMKYIDGQVGKFSSPDKANQILSTLGQRINMLDTDAKRKAAQKEELDYQDIVKQYVESFDTLTPEYINSKPNLSAPTKKTLIDWIEAEKNRRLSGKSNPFEATDPAVLQKFLDMIVDENTTDAQALAYLKNYRGKGIPLSDYLGYYQDIKNRPKQVLDYDYNLLLTTMHSSVDAAIAKAERDGNEDLRDQLRDVKLQADLTLLRKARNREFKTEEDVMTFLNNIRSLTETTNRGALEDLLLNLAGGNVLGMQSKGYQNMAKWMTGKYESLPTGKDVQPAREAFKKYLDDQNTRLTGQLKSAGKSVSFTSYKVDPLTGKLWFLGTDKRWYHWLGNWFGSKYETTDKEGSGWIRPKAGGEVTLGR